MAHKLIPILILITLLVAPIVSATIIWSEPVTIGFYIDYEEEQEEDEKPRSRTSGQPREITVGKSCDNWQCGGNQLTRTCTENNIETTETGGACGLDLTSEQDVKQKLNGQKIIWTILLILFALINLITLLLIYTVMRR